jgi:hypothetical protein
MRKLIMIASVAALATALPNVAAAQGRGNGNGHSARADQGPRGNAKPQSQGMQRERMRQVERTRDTDLNRNRVADRLERRLVDRNRDGIDDRRQTRLVDRDRDGIDDRAQNRYGGAACPPGLANRSPACVPPGQAKRMFREGQRIPTNFNVFTNYNDIPVDLRQRYNIPQDFNYIYRDDSVYVVDPATRVVRSIIDLLR